MFCSCCSLLADGFWQSDLNFQAKAIEALQHAAEEYIARLFDDVSLFRVCWTSAVAYLLPQTNMEAMHAKRCTVFPQDMKVWQLYCTCVHRGPLPRGTHITLPQMALRIRGERS